MKQINNFDQDENRYKWLVRILLAIFIIAFLIIATRCHPVTIPRQSGKILTPQGLQNKNCYTRRELKHYRKWLNNEKRKFKNYKFKH